MKKIIFTTLFALTLIFPSAVLAQTSSTSASPTSEQTNTNLKERIDKVIEQRKDQVKGVIDKIGQKKRGFIAEVERVTQNTVTVKNQKGTQILIITPDIVIVKENKKATLDDIAVGDWVMAMGYMNQEDFTLKRLVVSSQSLMPPIFDTTVGALQSFTRTQAVLLPRHAEKPVTFLFAPTTRYQDFQGKTTTQSSLKTDNQYLVISSSNKDQQTATLFRSLAPAATPSTKGVSTNAGQ